MSSVYSKLVSICQSNQSRIALMITPRLEKMPLYIQRYDEAFLPFGKTVINATRSLVSAYLFDLPAYMALGAAGMVALERTIDYVGSEHVTVLHAAFGLADFAIVMDENAFGVDAVTIAPDTYEAPFYSREDRTAFPVNYGQVGDQNAFYVNHGVLRCQDISLTVTDEAFLYQHRLEDFADVLKARVEALRAQS